MPLKIPAEKDAFRRLLKIMAQLRSKKGCPWDRRQTHASLKPYLIEETYELIEAIDSGDTAKLRGELGDLLLQAVFHAQLAAEKDISVRLKDINYEAIGKGLKAAMDVFQKALKRKNYMAFQVRVDGVPLEGQVPLPLFTTPVVFVSIDASTANDDEQFIDPTKPVAYNFFIEVPKGSHVVEVLGAAGSGIDPANPPTATHLVLTLEYR